MKQCPFLLRLCQEVLLRVSDDFSFSTVPLSRKRKAVSDRPIHKWNKPSHTAGKPGRMIVVARLDKSCRIGKQSYFLCGGLPFSRSGDVFFILVVPYFTDFPLKFFSTQSASVFVYLHFAPFSEPHQSVIFVLGAKVIPGLDGNARSSLLFSEKISSPAGSIFPEKPCIP